MGASRTPKKTETIEVRLPFETKQAFMARCQAAGVTASEALRGFIGEFTAEARPARRAGLGGHRLRLGLAAGAVIAAAALAQPSLARAGVDASFARMDADHDGRVSFAEFARATTPEVVLEVGVGGPVKAAGPVSTKLRDEMLREAFARLDRDGDGELTLEEWRRAYAR